jgi:trehalose utilization protein
MVDKIRVTVWNEYRHEKESKEIARIYPQGIHAAIARFLSGQPGIEVRTATLDEPEHGLTDEVLANTDVLIWWGHMAHGEVSDAIVDKVQARILNGMGLIVLHSAHFSKVFRRMMGTSCSLKWREIGERERLWVVLPGHPIAEGLGEYFEIPHCEMYGEYFDIPQPDELVFISWYQGGEVFRSGCCFYRGRGKIFYFKPGHETLPIYHQPEVQQVIVNAVRWAAPVNVVGFRNMPEAPNVPQPLERVTVEE